MKFNDVWDIVKNDSLINKKRAMILYKMIRRESPNKCIELGTAHGASACIIAAALDELKGDRYIDTVDLINHGFKPTIEELSKKCGLESYINIYRENSSYTWFLKKKIEAETKKNICNPYYDFAFIDGSKNWNYDGLSFFLVDKLLKPNGVIIFDDMYWTYSMKDDVRNETDGISHRLLSKDEKEQPHISLIFELLVKQHPNYHQFSIIDNWWGTCKKKV